VLADPSDALEASPQPRGVVLAVVSIDGVVNKALSYLAREAVHTFLYDRPMPEPEAMLYAHSYDPSQRPAPLVLDRQIEPSPADLYHHERFVLAGREWSVTCVGLAAFAAARHNWHHWGVGMTGLMLTLLLTAHLAATAGRSGRIERLVDQQTNALSSANVELRREMRQRQQTQLALELAQAELGLARRVQLGLLPLAAPSISGIDIAGASYPASRVSGDHFDFINVDNEQLGIVIGDASGHGLGAAMLMVEIRACVRAAATLNHHLPDILSITNRVVTEGMPEGRFITLLLAAVDPTNRALVYANAGHPAGFVLDAHGRTRHSLKSQCMPLGIDADINASASEVIALEEGDLVLLLTDGVLDAMSAANEVFGEQRVLDLVRRVLDQPAAAIIERLHEAILAHCGDHPPHDDITMVVVKIAAPAVNRNSWEGSPSTASAEASALASA
jgi:serine phosphatase RsbU (regulator of sigma subunit)